MVAPNCETSGGCLSRSSEADELFQGEFAEMTVRNSARVHENAFASAPSCETYLLDLNPPYLAASSRTKLC